MHNNVLVSRVPLYIVMNGIFIPRFKMKAHIKGIHLMKHLLKAHAMWVNNLFPENILSAGCIVLTSWLTD